MKPNPGENHHQFIQRVKAAGQWESSTDCSASHMTFGGQCLNCGFIPVPKKRNPFDRVKTSSRLGITGPWDDMPH